MTSEKHGSHDAANIKVGPKHHHGLIVQRVRPTWNKKAMRFVSLHHHSTFSYMDGYAMPEAHIRRATELQMPAMAMTEHGNIDSHVKFEVASEGSGVKPLFGCEVYMPTTGVDKEGRTVPWNSPEAKTQRKHHLTVLAKDAEGYRNLLQLITNSWRNFYHEPTVSWDELVARRAGLIVLSGCQGSLLACSTVGGKGIEPEEASYRRGLRIAQMFSRTFDDYFIEVQAFPELEATRRFNALAGKLARGCRRRIVATMDCHYTLLEEAEVQKILHNLRPGNRQTIEEQAREWGYAAPLCPPPNDGTIIRRLRASGLSKAEAVEAVVSTEEIAQACSAVLPKLPMVRFPVPGGGPLLDYWRRRLREGWMERGCDRLPAAERDRYRKQLAHEMELIESKDFVDYFMLVAAGVKYIKDLNIPVGPARGSAAASLAAWLLRITEINPLRAEFGGLLRFERFIDVTRLDLPDIDLDFPSEARPLLRDFYVGMFGPGCVNNVGTFVMFKNKVSVDDVARVFGVPKFEVDHVKNFLIERSSGDLRASSTIEDTIEQFPQAAEVFTRYPDLKKAAWLEGNAKGFGVHAAALVLSNEPITSVTAVAEREVPKGSGNVVQVVALDKHAAERQGLVKMDFLGLNTMSLLWDAQKRLGWGIDDLYNLPLDDEAVYNAFRAVDVVGIFQFEGRAQRYVCATLKPDKFSEIMDCNALSRPGPLHNGAARTYADIKHGLSKPESIHPALDRITSMTQFQLVYQEQILAAARDIGGFDNVGVATTRKIISLKKGEQAFNAKQREFTDGALTIHERLDVPPMDRETALAIWGNMITSGAYAFNAAHCAAYGLIGVMCMWLKVHEPDVFYAAALAEATGNRERTRELLRDADKHNVKVRLPDLACSERSWSPVRPAARPTILAGFNQAEGVGPKAADAIAEARDAGQLEGWGDLTKLRGFGPKTVLKVTDWLKAEDPFGAFALDRNIKATREQLERGDLRDELGEALPKVTHTSTALASDDEQGKAVQCVWLGTFVKRNIRDLLEQNRARGIELNLKTLKDPELTEWALLTGEDDTDQLLIKVDRWRYPEMKEALFGFKMGHDLLLIRAVKPARSAVRKLNVKQLWVLDPDD